MVVQIRFPLRECELLTIELLACFAHYVLSLFILQCHQAIAMSSVD